MCVTPWLQRGKEKETDIEVSFLPSDPLRKFRARFYITPLSASRRCMNEGACAYRRIFGVWSCNGFYVVFLPVMCVCVSPVFKVDMHLSSSLFKQAVSGISGWHHVLSTHTHAHTDTPSSPPSGPRFPPSWACGGSGTFSLCVCVCIYILAKMCMSQRTKHTHHKDTPDLLYTRHRHVLIHHSLTKAYNTHTRTHTDGETEIHLLAEPKCHSSTSPPSPFGNTNLSHAFLKTLLIHPPRPRSSCVAPLQWTRKSPVLSACSHSPHRRQKGKDGMPVIFMWVWVWVCICRSLSVGKRYRKATFLSCLFLFPSGG